MVFVLVKEEMIFMNEHGGVIQSCCGLVFELYAGHELFFNRQVYEQWIVNNSVSYMNSHNLSHNTSGDTPHI